MKITYLIHCFLVLLISLCGKSKQGLAQIAFSNFLDTSLNDNKSYQNIELGKLVRLKDTVTVLYGKPDSLKYHGDYMIEHTYRTNNSFGPTSKKPIRLS